MLRAVIGRLSPQITPLDGLEIRDQQCIGKFKVTETPILGAEKWKGRPRVQNGGGGGGARLVARRMLQRSNGPLIAGINEL